MGEVYKAHDEVLDRSVALKVLRSEVAADADRIRRFTQEAKAASALNHPHIVHIYDVGISNATHFIAMEYVEGETLHHVIHTQSVSLKKILGLLAETAEGLEKAHASGIVHRDLKPDNIIVSNDGYAKILDFGLAKLLDNRPLAEDTATTERPLSQEGLVLGTVGYMAPEQVLGRKVDQRADIFAFGCILYEAVTRTRAFQGTSTFDTLHRIARQSPPPLPADTPSRLREIITGCLAKDPADRLQSAKQIGAELREIQQEVDSASTARTVAIQTPRSKQPLFIAGVVIVAIAGGFSVMLSRKVTILMPTQPGPPRAAPRFERLTSSGKAREAAISPDGRYIAYVDHDGLKGTSIVHVRDIATHGNATLVSGGYLEYEYVTFSPSNEYLYFTHRREGRNDLYRAPILGGQPKKILEDLSTPVAFSPDGARMCFIRSADREDQLIIANADGGEEQLVYRKKRGSGLNDGVMVPTRPAWVDGGHVAIALANPAMIISLDLRSRTAGRVDKNEWGTVSSLAAVPNSKKLVLAASRTDDSEASLWAYDPESHTAEPISSGVGAFSGAGISADGRRLVSTVRLTRAHLWSVPADRPATPAQISSGSSQDGVYGLVYVSDGRIAYWSNAGGNPDIWIAKADGTNALQLTFATARRKYYWLSAARTAPLIAYNVHKDGKRRVGEMDLSTGKELEIAGTEDAWWAAVSAGGDAVFYQLPAHKNSGLWRVAMSGGSPANVLAGILCTTPTIAPDGRRVACVSDPDGETAFAVFDLATAKLEKSFRPGTLKYPIRWTPDGRALLLVQNDKQSSNIWMYPVDGSPPRQLTHFESDIIWMFDISPDGTTLILSRGGVEDDVVMISNFH